MKFNLLSENPSAPNYADPAFSPDPLSNPLFSSNQTPPWSSPPGPGHPTLKKQRPLDAYDFNPPQPPNTPVPEPDTAPDNSKAESSNPSTINSPNIPSFTDSSSLSLTKPASAVPSASSSSPSRDPPSSARPHVHPKVDMPHDAHHLPPQHSQHPPSSKPESKKRQGFLSKLLGSSSSDSSDSSASSTSSPPPPSGSRKDSTMLRVQQSQSPPYNIGPRPIPVHHHRATQSAPEVNRSDRQALPSRAKTVGTAEAGRIVPVVAAASAAGRAADDRRLRQDLDRIDELDETNPFGAAVHHGGPYEAISRFVQKDATPKLYVGPAQGRQSNGRSVMMSGDIYRNAQMAALQKGTLGLKPGQILARDFPPNTEPSYPHSYSHLDTQPQQSRHLEQYSRHTYLQPNVPMREPRFPVEQPGPTQMVPSVLQANSLSNHPGTEPINSLTDPPPKRSRTPSPIAATTHSDDDDSDAGLAIGMALMGAGHNSSHTNDASATVTNSEVGSSPNIKFMLREPSDVDEPSPPPYMFEQPDPSPSRVQQHVDVNRSLGPAAGVNNYREEVWEEPPVNIPQQPFPTREPMLRPAPVPVPVPVPVHTPPLSRHTSWHPQPPQPPPPQIYSRPSRQEIQSLQPQPLPQQRIVTANNPGLSRSSTYAPGSSGSYPDRSALASLLKAGGGTPPSSTPSSLHDRESDARSVQQSIMTTSNASGASSRSQGGENPRRNRYLPKRLVMPTPLQPAIQNQVATHQVRFDPQANSVYSRDPSPSKGKRSSLVPQQSRAQDIPMAPSNGKLRKRVSLIGGLKTSTKEQAPPVAAVSFSANIVTADRTARGVEKPHKKVLSKRK